MKNQSGMVEDEEPNKLEEGILAKLTYWQDSC